jgi:hypothetical protein
VQLNAQLESESIDDVGARNPLGIAARPFISHLAHLSNSNNDKNDKILEYSISQMFTQLQICLNLSFLACQSCRAGERDNN